MSEDTNADASTDANSYKRGEVVQIINSVIDKVHEADTFCLDSLQSQLGELKTIIEEAREALTTVRPSEIKNTHIPTASDELDEVIKATEQATETIMDSCELIQGHFDSMDSVTGEEVEKEITKIYEACSFQDITGQRITKVVSALSQIDEKVSVILDIVGHNLPGYDEADDADSSKEGDSMTDDVLLHGPQKSDQAISQEEIDKLLAEFD